MTPKWLPKWWLVVLVVWLGYHGAAPSGSILTSGSYVAALIPHVLILPSSWERS